MISCRSDVYKLVQDLHSIGIVHGDLEPQNIVRTHGGGFLLIDFSESRKHVCKERKVQYMDTARLVANTEIGQRTPHPSRSG
jgi:tRNA A-37 threonylcarbamoyl transferase component Bud32